MNAFCVSVRSFIDRSRFSIGEAREVRIRGCLASFCHSISTYTGIYCHLRRDFLVCKLKNKKHITDKVNVGIFLYDIGFSIVKSVSPDGFFGIQILPNSITAGELTTPISPFPIPLSTPSATFLNKSVAVKF